MNELVNIHFIGLKKVFILLFSGKYLIYFLPGILITLIFKVVFSYTYLEETNLNSFSGILNSVLSQLYLFFLLTILSPINAIVSNKLDQQITGDLYLSSLRVFITDLFRMIFIVMISIFLELIIMVFCWVLSYFLDISFINKSIFFIISSFFFGLSFYDYSLERHRLNVFSSVLFSFKNPLKMIIAGSIFLFFSFIPLVGIILAPIILTMMTTIVYLYSIKKISL